MGAQQSSAGSNPTPGDNARTCYYELLAVDRFASAEEIKIAYRKKALQLHPDRNLEDVENATRRFAEVQTAYEVLSDSQERAWYDSHRDVILCKSGPGDVEISPTELGSIKLTTAEDIVSLIRQFNSSVSYTDEPFGFFGILREQFTHLCAEETAASISKGQGPVKYPPFGLSAETSSAKLFYSAWSGFSTQKSFSWREQYRLPDAPDRRVRRWMEKENKRLREEGKREFNETVRFLVRFARKRDPRYTPEHRTDAQRQQTLRDAAAAQAIRSRTANLRRLAESSVPVTTVPSKSPTGDPAEFEYPDSDEPPERIEIECVVCKKLFKSENQFKAHERSNKHVKAVQQLWREMRRDGVDLKLDVSTTSPERPGTPAHVLETTLVNESLHSVPIELPGDYLTSPHDTEDNMDETPDNDEDTDTDRHEVHNKSHTSNSVSLAEGTTFGRTYEEVDIQPHMANVSLEEGFNSEYVKSDRVEARR